MTANMRTKIGYASYGNVAYAPTYEGSVTRRLEREKILQPRPRVRTREQAQARPRVRVREQGKISVFAVIGFLAVGIFAALVLMSYASLTTINDQAVSLRSQLTKMQTEEAKLLAQYELTYDLKSIEENVIASGEMVRPQSGQIYTIDLSEPDSVTRYQKEAPMAGAVGALNGVKEIFTNIVEYFQ